MVMVMVWATHHERVEMGALSLSHSLCVIYLLSSPLVCVSSLEREREYKLILFFFLMIRVG